MMSLRPIPGQYEKAGVDLRLQGHHGVERCFGRPHHPSASTVAWVSCACSMQSTMVAKDAISPSMICTAGLASLPVISHSLLVSPSGSAFRRVAHLR